MAKSGSSYLPLIPAGIGIQSAIGDNLMLQVRGGYVLSLSDELDGRTRSDNDLNSITNSKHDAYYSITVGLIFGNRHQIAPVKKTIVPPVLDKIHREPVKAPVVKQEVTFSVRAPKAVVEKRRVRETFPLYDAVFFEDGSTTIPNRYVILRKEEAKNFKEEQLQEVQPVSMEGRSKRQLAVYYNTLNVLGDRMRDNPGSTITLSGASEKGSAHGKLRAEAVKSYLVDVFEIESSRITTIGTDKPSIPSVVRGGTRELTLLREEDRRVDISTNSPELLIQIGGDSQYMLKPVLILDEVEGPLDSHVFFNVEKAEEVLKSWSLEITDEQQRVQKYGPFMQERTTIPGNTILAGRPSGNFKVLLIGQSRDGQVVRKESSVRLIRRDAQITEAIRFSILYGFDKSIATTRYDKFLTEVVAKSISNNSVVVIRGHTDSIGSEEYNLNLSKERISDVKGILEVALNKLGKRQVTFETLELGRNAQYVPFENNLPEGRFYNRTVVIEFVPEQ